LLRRLTTPGDPDPVRVFLAADLDACLELLAGACEAREEFGGAAAAEELRTAPPKVVARRLRLLAAQIKRAWAVEDQAELRVLWGELQGGDAWRELSWRRRVQSLEARATQSSPAVRRLVDLLAPQRRQGAPAPSQELRTAWQEAWSELERELKRELEEPQ